jgi:hypothetical protein
VAKAFFSHLKIVLPGIMVCALTVGAARAADKPLSQDDVTLLLIGGASSQKVVDLVKQRGIGFQMTAELATEFRRDGADDSVIQVLENVGKGTPQTEAAPASQTPGQTPAQTNGQTSGQPGSQAGAQRGNTGSGAAPSGSSPANAAPASGQPTLLRPGRTSNSSGAQSGASSGSSPSTASSTAPPATAKASPPVVPQSPDSSMTNAAAGAAPTLAPPSSPSSPSGPVLAHHTADSPPTAASSSSAPAHRAPVVDLSDPGPDRVQQIIQAFAQKETLFKVARDNYTFHQINKVQELGPDNQVMGQFQQDWDILYDDNGGRIERVTYAPLDTLKQIILTEQDYDAFRQINPFVFTTEELPEYDVQYRGHVKLDEIAAYVFSVRPKVIQKGKQYFQGMVWVDDRDLQIVKSEGKQVPEFKTKNNENLFPHFTTWREQIDGKFWFPTFTLADDTLYFTSAPVHIKEVIRYTDYKQFKTSVKTRVIGLATNPNQQQPQNQKNPPPKP